MDQGFGKGGTILRVVAWLVLLLGAVLSLAAWSLMTQYAEQRTTYRFERLASAVSETVQERLDARLSLLHQVRGLFLASEQVAEQGFHDFLEAVGFDLGVLQGIGFARRTDGRGGESYPIRYWEAGHVFVEERIGNDPYANRERKSAMERARDMDAPVATELLTVSMHEDAEVAGLVIYLPLYGRGMPLGTVNERREALQGFVFVVFSGATLFEALFGGIPLGSLGVDFEVHLGRPDAAEGLLYANERGRALW
jgi:CHASE1-domain containing sensor protein